MPTNIVSPSSSLVLAEGGYLAITDAPGAAATRQTFNGTTINASLGTSGVNYGTYGFSTVAVNANGNTSPASALVLGTLTQSAGRAVNFVLPSAGNITTTTPNTNGIIGTWALVGGTIGPPTAAWRMPRAASISSLIRATLTITQPLPPPRRRRISAGVQATTLRPSARLRRPPTPSPPDRRRTACDSARRRITQSL